MTENAPITKAAALQMTERGVSLKTFEDAFRFSTAVVKSGLAPKGDTPEAVLVKLQAGAELGLTPMRSLSGIVVVNGKPTLEGHLALGLIRASGICAYFKIEYDGEGDTRRCTVSFKRRDTGEGGAVSFSMSDAKKAGLVSKDTYKNYADDMICWKAVSRASKRYFSDVTNGLDVAEHVADYVRSAQDAAPPERTALPPAEPDPAFDAIVDKPFELSESARLDAEIAADDARR
jgi:hypothetical protein